MNTPIKSPHRPHAAPPRQATPPESAPSSDSRQSLGGLRRSEPDRLRSAWNLPTPNDAAHADGLFFSQLLVPPVSEGSEQSEFGGSGLSLFPQGEGMPTQLVDELAERLPAQPDGPFSVTLLMPNLGKVQVNANKRDNQWNIELAFARRGVLKRVQPYQRSCEQALAEALGHEVDLSFNEDHSA